MVNANFRSIRMPSATVAGTLGCALGKGSLGNGLDLRNGTWNVPTTLGSRLMSPLEQFTAKFTDQAGFAFLVSLSTASCIARTVAQRSGKTI